MDLGEAVESLFDSAPRPPPNKGAPFQSKGAPKPQPQKRKQDGSQPPAEGSKPAKNRKKGKGKGSKGSDSNQPGHDKAPMPGVRSMYQRRSHYLLLCGNRGVDLTCEVVFNTIQFRDFRTANNVTLPQLKYCVCLALWAREASVAVEYGYIDHEIPDLSQLIRCVKGLQLPDVLAKYVECVGTFEMVTGVAVAPWFSSRDQMLNPALEQIDPDNLLVQAGRPIPANYWSIDREWIALWNQATTRPARLGMKFRPVRWAETTGSCEMIVTPLIHGEFVRPTAPQRLTDPEGALGSAYLYRSFAQHLHWPAQTSLVCTRLMYGTEVFVREFYSEVVVNSFVSSEK